MEILWMGQRNPNHQWMANIPLLIGFQHVSTIPTVVQDLATIHSITNVGRDVLGCTLHVLDGL
jgi:hypothetical protein